MANWLHQLQSLLGQQGASPSGESSKGAACCPAPSVGWPDCWWPANRHANCWQNMALARCWQAAGRWRARCYGTSISRKCARRIRPPEAPETAAAPSDVDPRSVRLITAPVFAAKSDGHIDDHERANIETQLRAANIDVQARVLIDRCAGPAAGSAASRRGHHRPAGGAGDLLRQLRGD